MLIGYARVSTADQDLTLQLDALGAAGCEKIFTEQASGKKVERAGLTDALAFARKGDTLIVWKLDRLGRSMKGLVDLAAELDTRGIDLRSLTDGIDTKATAGRFFFHILAAMAEMERELILERTRAGLEAAKRNGKVGGRPPSMTSAKIEAAQKLLESGMDAKGVASSLHISISTLYRHLPARDRMDNK
ncbi:DNA-invertase hin [compost metagenome]